MNPMVPGLQGSKMSSSDPGMKTSLIWPETYADILPDSKIDLLDTPDVVTKKIKKAEAAPKVAEGNGLLSFTEFVLLPAASLSGTGEFIVERERDGLEPLVYTDGAQMKSDYENDIVRPSPRCNSARLQLTFPSFPPNSSSPPSPKPSTPSWLPSRRRSRPPRSGRRLLSRPTHQKRRRRRKRRSRTRVAATPEEVRPPRMGRRLLRSRLPRNSRVVIAERACLERFVIHCNRAVLEGGGATVGFLRACLGLEVGMVEQKCVDEPDRFILCPRRARDACSQ